MIWKRNICGLQREWQVERYFYNRELAQAGNNPQQLAALNAKYP